VIADLPYGLLEEEYDNKITMQQIEHTVEGLQTSLNNEDSIWVFFCSHYDTSELLNLFKRRNMKCNVCTWAKVIPNLQGQQHLPKMESFVIVYPGGTVTVKPKGFSFDSFVLSFPTEKHFLKRDDGVEINLGQKPLDLITWFINNFTTCESLVIDLCSGTGTTAMACLLTGRNCVSFENNTTQFNAAVKRLHDFQFLFQSNKHNITIPYPVIDPFTFLETDEAAEIMKKRKKEKKEAVNVEEKRKRKKKKKGDEGSQYIDSEAADSST
jgi:hypothetical protein